MALVRAGVNVFIGARHPHEINGAVSRLNNLNGGQAAGFVCEGRDLQQVQALYGGAVNTFGGVVTLVSKSRIGIFHSFETMGSESLRSRLGTDLLAPFY